MFQFLFNMLFLLLSIQVYFTVCLTFILGLSAVTVPIKEEFRKFYDTKQRDYVQAGDSWHVTSFLVMNCSHHILYINDYLALLKTNNCVALSKHSDSSTTMQQQWKDNE